MLGLRGVCIAGIILLLSGCASNVTSRVNNQMDSENLNQKLGTQANDLAVDGRCPGTKSLKVINAETRTEKYCVNDAMGCRWYIIPKDMAEYVVKYIDDNLKQSNVKTGSEYDHAILVSLDEIKASEGVWSFGSSSRIKIEIPDINYTQTYRGESGSGLGFHAIAYAIHLSVDKFIKDPVFQNYVKCH